jgi:ankyrin repeat protein
MNTNSFLCRLFYSKISPIAIVLLITLAWRSIALGSDEILHATMAGDLAKVKELLKNDPNQIASKMSFNGMTLLHLAAQRGRKDVAELLRRHGGRE